MAYSQAKLEKAKTAAAAAGPCVVEEIPAIDKWKAPAFFECTSGVLLWGQLPTVMQGFLETEVDTPLGPHETIEPGVENDSTILRHCFRYRAPARKGLWKVESLGPIGYICHHVDVSKPDLERRATEVGVSLENDHADRDIVYVNRYDWAIWGCPQAGSQLMTELLKPEKKSHKPAKPLKVKSSFQERDGLDGDEEFSSEDEEDEDEEDESDEGCPGAISFDTDDDEDNAVAEREDYEDALTTNRLMLVDEQGFPQLVQSLRDGFKLYSKNYLFRDNKKQGSEPAAPATGEPSSSSDAFGVNLGVGETENELGWLAFQNRKLVGFVYDGTGSGLSDDEDEDGEDGEEGAESEDCEDGEESEDGEDGEDGEGGCSRSTKRLRR